MYKIYVYIDNDIDHIYIYVFEKQKYFRMILKLE